MQHQKIFSKKALEDIRGRFLGVDGDASYLREVPFAAAGFEELESPDIELCESLPARADPASDVDTAIALFEAFPSLNPLQASSAGFWTHLTHVELWDYMRRRFPLPTGGDRKSRESRIAKIEEKWFLPQTPSQSALIHHPLAGLWWGVKLSVAPERGEDRKYDLTRILYRNLDLPTRTLGTYELGRLPAAVKGTLGYVFDHPELFEEEYEAKMRAIMRLLNSIGGVLQLGCLEEKFFRSKIDENRPSWIAARKKKGN